MTETTYDPNHEPGLSECGCRMCDPKRYGLTPTPVTTIQLVSSTPATIAEIHARYLEIAPGATAGTPDPALNLARWLTFAVQRGFTRMLSPHLPMDHGEMLLMMARFEGLHLLTDRLAEGRAEADRLAREVLDAEEDGGGIGEWLYEHGQALGLDTGEVDRLADREAELEAAAAPVADVNAQANGSRPRIVCLCGSTRNYDEFRRANLRLTLAGQIVLSIGCDTKSDGDLAAAGELDIDLAEVKALLDDLHKRKVDLADYVLVVSDEAGYFGQSTAGEIAYAVKHGKPVLFAHQAAAERAKSAGLLPAGMTPCRQPHTPGYRCFDCATDDEIAASIPDSIADHPDDCRGTCCKDALRDAQADDDGSLEDAGTLDDDPEDDPWDNSGRPATQDIL